MSGNLRKSKMKSMLNTHYLIVQVSAGAKLRALGLSRVQAPLSGMWGGAPGINASGGLGALGAILKMYI